MKITETFPNPVNYTDLEHFFQAVYDAGLREAQVSFRDYVSRDYTGDANTHVGVNGHLVEITVEGEVKRESS